MKHTDYSLLKKQALSFLEEEKNYLPFFSNLSAILNESLDEINWVGFYLVNKNGNLLLGPFQGKSACIHIPLGKGVCGTSVERDESLVVEDVHAFAGHIACDSASASEIVIPIHGSDGKVLAVLDIDSPTVARFTEEDRIGLEALRDAIEKLISWEHAI